MYRNILLKRSNNNCLSEIDAEYYNFLFGKLLLCEVLNEMSRNCTFFLATKTGTGQGRM